MLGELFTGLLATIALAGTVVLALRGAPIPPEITALDGLIGGAFFALRGASLGGRVSVSAQQQQQANGHT